MGKIDKWYQNLELKGADLPSEYSNRKNSNFWNEGKWNNFIKPLLPDNPKDMTFVELGSNVGLFPKMAMDYGFRDAWGIEKEADNTEMAKRYRNELGYDYKLLTRTAGEDFDFDELPVADVFLLSNVHYYMKTDKFLRFLDRLRFKAVHCIVVSRNIIKTKHEYPSSEIDPLKLYFKDWEHRRTVRASSNLIKNDPSPRKQWSLLFKSDLDRMPLSDFVIRGKSYGKHGELLNMAFDSGRFPEFSNYFKYWQERKKGRWSDAEVLRFVNKRIELARDIAINGQKEPIIARHDLVGIDGGNRSAFLKKLGYESVIVRKV